MSIQIIRQDNASVLTAQATLSETIVQPSTATSLPIEQGVPVTDHVQIQQLSYIAPIRFSDTGAPGAIRNATAYLNANVISGVLCDIVTLRDGVLEDMILLSASFTNSTSLGRTFSTVWRQIRQVDTVTSTLSRLSGEQDIGDAGTVEPEPVQSQVNKTALITLLGI